MTFKTPTLLQKEQANVDILNDAGEVVASLYARAGGFDIVTAEGWTAEYSGQMRDEQNSPLRLCVFIAPLPRGRR